ncbi:MAG: 1-acyl-sn-glycerol-3-phosphate acyltransferase [Candidatus Gastranaerophilales bacterium]|nr:1-acyl-sn-glycerol-3-phosphate acyltransferase [Candidatus Gastranaerophilales bacterium]
MFIVKDKMKKNFREELYDYIPPSLRRKKADPFIKAKFSPFWMMIWDFFVSQMISRRFYSIRIKNLKHYDAIDPDAATIFYAQHNCWWDGIIGYYLCRNILKVPMNIMVEDLIKFPLLANVGAFSVDKKSPKSTLHVVNYCADFLTKEKINLWLFPQGVIKPPNHRPLEFQKGLTYIAQKCKKINLIPVAVQYPFVRQGLPEVLIDMGKPIFLDKDINRSEYTAFLENDFTNMLENQLTEISNGEIYKYEIFWRKADGFGKTLEKIFKNRIK